jgi:hypothetical protein
MIVIFAFAFCFKLLRFDAQTLLFRDSQNLQRVGCFNDETSQSYAFDFDRTIVDVTSSITEKKIYCVSKSSAFALDPRSSSSCVETFTSYSQGSFTSIAMLQQGFALADETFLRFYNERSARPHTVIRVKSPVTSLDTSSDFSYLLAVTTSGCVKVIPPFQQQQQSITSYNLALLLNPVLTLSVLFLSFFFFFF